MTVVQAAVLGIVQGLTEFLPVSSSGHLIFFPKLFGWTDQGLAFDVIIHGGTLLAVLLYFRSSIRSMLVTNRRMAYLILFSALPAILVGGLFGDAIEARFRSAHLVAWNLIFWGIVLGIAEWYGKKKQIGQQINTKTTVLMGLGQVLALIPGTSRSGITITTGLFVGLNKKTAAEFSFLMSIPVILLAGGKKVFDIIQVPGDTVAFLPLVVGFSCAAMAGMCAIHILLRIIERWNFLPFVLYRIAIGVAILLFLV